jgi:hypothetical protein
MFLQVATATLVTTRGAGAKISMGRLIGISRYSHNLATILTAVLLILATQRSNKISRGDSIA